MTLQLIAYERESGLALLRDMAAHVLLRPPYSLEPEAVEETDVGRLMLALDLTLVNQQFESIDSVIDFLRAAIHLNAALNGRDLSIGTLYATAVEELDDDALLAIAEELDPRADDTSMSAALAFIVAVHGQEQGATSAPLRRRMAVITRNATEILLGWFVPDVGSPSERAEEWIPPKVFFGQHH